MDKKKLSGNRNKHHKHRELMDIWNSEDAVGFINYNTNVDQSVKYF